MLKTSRVLLITALILFSPITGLIFGILSFNGAFIKWKPLGQPPERPTEVLAADVRNTSVYVKTISGQIYQCCYGKDLSSWATREEREVGGYNFPDCLMGEKDDEKHLRNEIDNYAVYWCGEWDSGRAYYAIRNDGSVWVWKESSVFPDWVIQLCGYPFIGLILSAVIGLCLWIISKRHKLRIGST